MPEPITVFILSWERPLYLWACLDSLYRHTRFPRRFVLVDNGSRDPLVQEVITGFERRGMFHEVHREAQNVPETIHKFLGQYWDSLGEHFAYVESDVVIERCNPCWLTRMVRLARADEKLAMLGAYIDGDDFIPEATARKIEPSMEAARLRDLIKAASPERDIPQSDEAIISPFNPPGRLLLLRKQALGEVLRGTDGRLHLELLDRGYRTGIATGVRHRHLSLLNLFDYPHYDFDNRHRYMKGVDAAGKRELDSFSDSPSSSGDRAMKSSIAPD